MAGFLKKFIGSLGLSAGQRPNLLSGNGDGKLNGNLGELEEKSAIGQDDNGMAEGPVPAPRGIGQRKERKTWVIGQRLVDFRKKLDNFDVQRMENDPQIGIRDEKMNVVLSPSSVTPPAPFVSRLAAIMAQPMKEQKEDEITRKMDTKGRGGWHGAEDNPQGNLD